MLINHTKTTLTLLLLTIGICAFSQEKKFKYDGDFRLRSEANYGQDQAWHRVVVRFRLRASFEINKLLSANIGIGTGSKEDPNTNDVTLGDFNDKLELNIFTSNIEFNHKGLTAFGGKFNNPFVQTEMVWDPDLYPQGVSMNYDFNKTDQTKPFISGLYFIIDEQYNYYDTNDSYMLGFQSGIDHTFTNTVNATFTAAYYHYSIGSISNADALSSGNSGDIRTNYLNADSSNYLNKFKLIDALLKLKSQINNQPIGININGVYNFGATNENRGILTELYFGQTSQIKDYKILYGFSILENEAVFAAFTNDNTTLATNYLQHNLNIDYVIAKNSIIGINYYLYSQLTNPNPQNQNLSRIRVNVVLKF